MKEKTDDSIHRPVPKIALRLYVTGSSPKSVQAKANLDSVCREYLADGVDLEIVDVLEDPLRMLSDGVVATPSLVRLAPAPEMRTIGDLSDRQTLCLMLGVVIKGR